MLQFLIFLLSISAAQGPTKEHSIRNQTQKHHIEVSEGIYFKLSAKRSMASAMGTNPPAVG